MQRGEGQKDKEGARGRHRHAGSVWDSKSNEEIETKKDRMCSSNELDILS